jgi:hypothetical protein
MKRWLIGGLAGLSLAALVLTAAHESTTAAEKELTWLTDYEKARTSARQSGKPLLVVFRCER